MGFSKSAPLSTSAHSVHSGSPENDLSVFRTCFGLTRPAFRSCSAFVVSHHLDGFLRCIPCRFVAPCCQIRGSPCCTLSRTFTEMKTRDTATARYPSKPDLVSSLFPGFLPEISPFLPFPIQGWCDYKGLFRWTSSKRAIAVADNDVSLLPWVFFYADSTLFFVSMPLLRPAFKGGRPPSRETFRKSTDWETRFTIHDTSLAGVSLRHVRRLRGALA